MATGELIVGSERLLEQAAAQLNGITESYLRVEFQTLLLEFLRRSTAWRKTIREMETSNHVLDIGKYIRESEVLGILGPIRMGRRWIFPFSDSNTMFETYDKGPEPTLYRLLDESYSMVSFLPELTDEISGLSATVFLAPRAGGCEELPNFLRTHYLDAILNGLVGRLMMVPRKPYTNMREGADKLQIFERGIRSARTQANKGRTTSAASWRYPYWA